MRHRVLPPEALLNSVSPHSRRLAGAGALALVGSALDLARPWPLLVAVDYAFVRHQGNSEFGWLSWLSSFSPRVVVLIAAAASVTFTALLALVDYLVVVLTERAAEQIGADLRQTTFEHTLNLSLRYHDQTPSGELVSRLTTDVGRILDAVVAAATDLIPNLALVVGMLVILLGIDPGLALIGLAAIPVLAWLSLHQRRNVRATQLAARAEAGRLASTSTDLLRNVRAVQAFGRQRRAASLFGERNNAVLGAEVDAINVEARWAPRSDLLLAIVTGAVLVVGGNRVLSGSMTTGTLLLVLTYLGTLYSPVRSLARLAATFAKAGASATRLDEVLSCTEQVTEDAHPVPTPRVKQSVAFDAVDFSYADGQPVLQRLSFEVAAGRKVCLWGASGAGKSTVLHLLLRLYDVDGGSVTIDGVDIRRTDLAGLRRQIGFVPQDPWLLDGTIAANIAFGADGVTRAAVLEAGRAARVDEFALSMPDGYDSAIGEGGSRLSGGQRRRIAIARAIVTGAPMLLLDEPTASLDAESVASVVEAIEAVGTLRTVIIATHDVALARIADDVVVIDRYGSDTRATTPLEPARSVPAGAPTQPASEGREVIAC
jgi:ATP-binding cassette, subfamily B, bacterial